jgi:hypothetical protein
VGLGYPPWLVAQEVPFSTNDAGFPVLPVWVAWNPMVVDWFGPMVAL